MSSYGLNNEILLRLLSLIFSDPGFGSRVANVLDPEHIGQPSIALVYGALKEYAARGRVPENAVLRQMIHNKYHSGEVRGEVVDDALDLIETARKLKPLSRSDAQMLLKGAIYDVEIFKALDDGYKLHKDREYDKVFERMWAAQRSVRALELGSLGSNFDGDGRRAYYDRIERKEASVERFPIGVADLDKLLKGGLGRGELGCLLAAEKDGKSMGLTHIGASNVLLGKTVVHISAELARRDNENRFASNLTGIPLDDIEEGGPGIARLVETRLEEIMQACGGHMAFKRFPPGVATVADINAHLIDIYRFWEVKPDVLIVDYADELTVKNVRGSDSNTYEKLGQIYTELLALAASEEDSSGISGGLDCAVWTASQIQRSAIGKDVTDFRHVADSILKAAKVSLMVGICRNDYEREADDLRLYIALCRFAQFPKEVGPYRRDYAHARLVELTEKVRRFDEESIAWIKRSAAKASEHQRSMHKTKQKKQSSGVWMTGSSRLRRMYGLRR
jgi:hypothetical protein